MSTQRDNAVPVKAFTAKLKNRRVVGGILKDGSFTFKFKNLVGKEIITHRIRLTQEALSTMCAIARELVKPDNTEAI